MSSLSSGHASLLVGLKRIMEVYKKEESRKCYLGNRSKISFLSKMRDT